MQAFSHSLELPTQVLHSRKEVQAHGFEGIGVPVPLGSPVVASASVPLALAARHGYIICIVSCVRAWLVIATTSVEATAGEQSRNAGRQPLLGRRLFLHPVLAS